MMERIYRIPGFRSFASAGDGSTFFWHRRDRSGNEAVLRPAFRHEFGHHFDERHQIAGSSGWESAVQKGFGNSQFATFSPSDAIAAQHNIQVTPDHSRPYPYGITKYGQADSIENLAEAFALYLAGQIGEGSYQPGKPAVPVWFRDIWPDMARYLDRFMPPDYVAQQIEEIRQSRRALP